MLGFVGLSVGTHPAATDDRCQDATLVAATSALFASGRRSTLGDETGTRKEKIRD
jgi:hypothetical protein